MLLEVLEILFKRAGKRRKRAVANLHLCEIWWSGTHKFAVDNCNSVHEEKGKLAATTRSVSVSIQIHEIPNCQVG